MSSQAGRFRVAFEQYQKGVSFDESSHTYFYKNRTLTSVTTAVSSCFPKFNKNNEVAKTYAAKHGMSVKEVLDSWKKKSALGTVVHEALELALHNYFIEDYAEEYKGYLVPGFEFIHNLPSHLELIKTELMIYHPGFSVAGQVDFLLYNSLTGEIEIHDWKTNSSISSEGLNFGKYGFGGLTKLLDTNFWHYALQLSIYRYLLEKQFSGYKFGKLVLHHIPGNGKLVDIELPYLSDEAYYVLQKNTE